MPPRNIYTCALITVLTLQRILFSLAELQSPKQRRGLYNRLTLSVIQTMGEPYSHRQKCWGHSVYMQWNVWSLYSPFSTGETASDSTAGRNLLAFQGPVVFNDAVMTS